MLNTVIVVDDSDLDRYVARRVLEKADVASRVLEFSTAHDALWYLEASERRRRETEPHRPPALLLLDIAMPRMSGFEFLEALRSRVEAGHLPSNCVTIVFLSASIHFRDRERASTFSEVKEYIVKPIDVETAIRVARRAKADGGIGEVHAK